MSLICTRYAEALVHVADEKNALDVFAGELNEILKLMENQELREFLLNPEDGIVREYQRLSNKLSNTLEICILTPYPITPEQTETIREKFTSMYQAQGAVVTTEIDRSLIGGIRVMIGDRVFDNTVKYKLEELQKLLVENEAQ